VSRPRLTAEDLERLWPKNWIQCPGLPGYDCDEHLDHNGYCLTCDREHPYCPSCLYGHDTEADADKCYEGCATVLDKIVDALD
jgi:hypothetical protein